VLLVVILLLVPVWFLGSEVAWEILRHVFWGGILLVLVISRSEVDSLKSQLSEATQQSTELQKRCRLLEEDLHSARVELAPNDPARYCARADFCRVLSHLGRLRADDEEATNLYARAVADYDMAIRLAPTEGYYYRARADLHMEHEEYEHAVQDLTSAITLWLMLESELDPELYELRGEALARLGHIEAAHKDYTSALEIYEDLNAKSAAANSGDDSCVEDYEDDLDYDYDYVIADLRERMHNLRLP